MARYLARACPRCNGYVGIIIREQGRNTPLQAVNGHCLRCSYRMAWIVIRGGKSAPAMGVFDEKVARKARNGSSDDRLILLES